MSKAKPMAAMTQISHWVDVRRVPGLESAMSAYGRTGLPLATGAPSSG